MKTVIVAMLYVTKHMHRSILFSTVVGSLVMTVDERVVLAILELGTFETNTQAFTLRRRTINAVFPILKSGGFLGIDTRNLFSTHWITKKGAATNRSKGI